MKIIFILVSVSISILACREEKKNSFKGFALYGLDFQLSKNIENTKKDFSSLIGKLEYKPSKPDFLHDYVLNPYYLVDPIYDGPFVKKMKWALFGYLTIKSQNKFLNSLKKIAPNINITNLEDHSKQILEALSTLEKIKSEDKTKNRKLVAEILEQCKKIHQKAKEEFLDLSNINIENITEIIYKLNLKLQNASIKLNICFNENLISEEIRKNFSKKIQKGTYKSRDFFEILIREIQNKNKKDIGLPRILFGSFFDYLKGAKQLIKKLEELSTLLKTQSLPKVKDKLSEILNYLDKLFINLTNFYDKEKNPIKIKHELIKDSQKRIKVDHAFQEIYPVLLNMESELIKIKEFLDEFEI